ncbi:MAG: CinA family nicotinamide mononucleotide deamidase-related protein [Chloroflexi bacterium]|nr:CinA family nicotinamide mononucleotide deamidase-related protein [Chloroflexota bacterium]MCH8817659.1 CinA family nicotinamide mononucleotide deamidase-related protein [Chloroflexota bacterium]
MNAEILAIGHELLMGEIVDTNSSYIAQQLAGTGITVRWMSHVGDDIDHLADAVRRGLERSDLLISTGGLGPTSDDLTREAVARAVGEEMSVDPDILAWLRDVFARRGMEMPPTNIKQATLIPSATSIPNPNGTAPGWWVEKDGKHLVLLPGPPREIRQIWEQTVGPRLASMSGTGVIATRTLKTYGLSEGGLDEILSSLFGRENPYLGIYAHTDGIHLRMIGRGPDRSAAEKVIEPMEAEIRRLIGDAIWGADDDTPARRAGALLVERKQTLAVVEGASAGTLASLLHAQPGRESFFRGALVPGSGPVHAGHEPATVDPDGAIILAQLARDSLSADVGLSVTPVSRDTAEEGATPAGSVFIGMVSDAGTHVATGHFPRRNAEWVMQRSATMAIVELLSALSSNRI